MKKTIILLSFVFITLGTWAQNYPIKIRVGQAKTLRPDTTALWVLTDSQYKVAVSKALDLVEANKELDEFRQKGLVYDNKVAELDSMKTALTTDRDFYKLHWETAEKDLKTLDNKLQRQKLVKNISLIAIPVAFLLGLIIAL